MEPDALDEAVIADTVTAVFAQADYARSLRESLFARFIDVLYRAWLWFRGLALREQLAHRQHRPGVGVRRAPVALLAPLREPALQLVDLVLAHCVVSIPGCAVRP
mgnify:CR=1 FL=1